MSENPDTPPTEEPKAPTVEPEVEQIIEEDDGVPEVSPFTMFMGDEDRMFDFRPRPVDEPEVEPEPVPKEVSSPPSSPKKPT